jgi:hypothetical protein
MPFKASDDFSPGGDIADGENNFFHLRISDKNFRNDAGSGGSARVPSMPSRLSLGFTVSGPAGGISLKESWP